MFLQLELLQLAPPNPASLLPSLYHIIPFITMRYATSTVAALAAAIPLVSAAVDISSIPRVSSANVVPNKYIVELASSGELPGSPGAKRAFSVRFSLSDYSPKALTYSPQPHLALKRRGSPWDVEGEFDANSIFVGATVSVNVSHVPNWTKTLHPLNAVPQDEAGLHQLAGVEGVKAIHPVIMHERPVPVDVHIPTGPDDARLPPDTFSTHKMAGVDKLHAEGELTHQSARYDT